MFARLLLERELASKGFLFPGLFFCGMSECRNLTFEGLPLDLTVHFLQHYGASLNRWLRTNSLRDGSTGNPTPQSPDDGAQGEVRVQIPSLYHFRFPTCRYSSEFIRFAIFSC